MKTLGTTLTLVLPFLLSGDRAFPEELPSGVLGLDIALRAEVLETTFDLTGLF